MSQYWPSAGRAGRCLRVFALAVAVVAALLAVPSRPAGAAAQPVDDAAAAGVEQTFTNPLVPDGADPWLQSY